MNTNEPDTLPTPTPTTRSRTYVYGRKTRIAQEPVDLLAVYDPERPLTVPWPGAPVSVANALHDAGWRVTRTSDPTIHSLPSALILVFPGGRTLLAPNRIVLKFKDTLDDAAVTHIFANHPLFIKYNLRTHHKLTHAKNLHVIESARIDLAAIDTLSLAQALATIPDVDHAEPSLLEPINPR